MKNSPILADYQIDRIAISLGNDHLADDSQLWASEDRRERALSIPTRVYEFFWDEEGAKIVSAYKRWVWHEFRNLLLRFFEVRWDEYFRGNDIEMALDALTTDKLTPRAYWLRTMITRKVSQLQLECGIQDCGRWINEKTWYFLEQRDEHFSWDEVREILRK